MEGAPSSIPSSPSLAVQNTHESLGYRRRSQPMSSLARSPTPYTTFGHETRIVHENDDGESENEGNDILGRYFDQYAGADETALTNLPSEPNEMDAKKFKSGDDQTTQIYADIAEFGGSARRHGGEYSRVPLLGAKTTKLYELLPAQPEPGESRDEFWRRNYTQILIWCLQKRIERLELRRSQSPPSSTQLQTLGALKAMQNALTSERKAIDWTRRPETPEPSLEAPRTNPDNVLNAQRVARAHGTLEQMNQKAREWIELLKLAERTVKTRPFRVDPAPTEPVGVIPLMGLVSTESERLNQGLVHVDALVTEARANLDETLTMCTSGVAASRTLKLLGSNP